jgi:7-cyano-7-deazaguanine synthase
MEKVSVLHSGGIDSTGVLLWYLSRNVEVQPLFVNYAQVAAATEWKHSNLIAKKLGIPPPIRLNAGVKQIYSSHSLISGRKTTRKKEGVLGHLIEEFFPNRNLFLLTVASVYCYQNHIDTIALGIIDGGDYGYTDTNPAFLRKANQLFRHTLNMEVKAPLISWSKQKVIQYIQSKGFDVANTYSCNVRSQKPCGKCAGCLERQMSL